MEILETQCYQARRNNFIQIFIPIQSDWVI